MVRIHAEITNSVYTPSLLAYLGGKGPRGPNPPSSGRPPCLIGS